MRSGKEVSKDYFLQEDLCFQRNPQCTDCSVQSSRVFKILESAVKIFTQAGWMAPLLSTTHVLLFVFPCTQPLELVLNCLNKTPLNTSGEKKKKKSSLFK